MDPVVAVVLRGALAVLFASAALHKLRDLPTFRVSLADYQLLPEAWCGAAALALAVFELVTAATLATPLFRGGALLGAGLLCVYSAAIVANLARGRRDIDCGCAGPALRQPLGVGLLVRNALLIAGALLCLLPTGARPFVWVDVVTVPAAIAVLAACYSAAQRVMATGAGVARLRAEMGA